MLFNSYQYFLFFLPVTVVVYFYLNRWRLTLASRSWLLLCSLFFYGWWDVRFLSLMLFSILFNYSVGTVLSRRSQMLSINPTVVLAIGVLVNLGLLCYFKYIDFVITTINSISSANLGLFRPVLPLAISFFTFQQIAYLMDSYKGETKEYSLLNYSLFVSFFPQLIAGPIVHHREMMPQFNSIRNKLPNADNISRGLYMFVMGLFKKLVIADSLAGYVEQGFDTFLPLSVLDSWTASLSYTFQIYFDFSGYMDMALGAALLLNIRLPRNFNSPYKAVNIQDFWRRWHITLGRFLREHVYIPLGGNRKGQGRVLANLIITFVIGGVWHGAGWTFVVWGTLHGIAIVIHRLWKNTGLRLNRWVAWFLTFNFLNASWVFFRARDWEHALHVIKAMLGMGKEITGSGFKDDIMLFEVFGSESLFALNEIHFILLLLLFICLYYANSFQRAERFNPDLSNWAFTVILGFFSFMYMDRIREFLYFQF